MEDALELARRNDMPGRYEKKMKRNGGGSGDEVPHFNPVNHRISVPSSGNHAEAVVLVSIVTEGEEFENRSRFEPHGRQLREEERVGFSGSWASSGPSAFRHAAAVPRGVGAVDRKQGDGLVEKLEKGRPRRLDRALFGTRAAGDRRDGLGSTRMAAAQGSSAGSAINNAADTVGGAEEGDMMRRRCLARLEAAAELGFEELARRHVRDFEGLFDRVQFSLGASSDSPSAANGVGLDLGGSGKGERRTGGDSCVAGLPIRTRVSRSGTACVESMGGREGGNDQQLNEEKLAVGEVAAAVVDDGLIELMYHYGRYVCVYLPHREKRGAAHKTVTCPYVRIESVGV